MDISARWVFSKKKDVFVPTPFVSIGTSSENDKRCDRVRK